ncbi:MULTISPECIES: filamentous hemagglutinin N-terminal domain-containing protein [Burkholderia]|uniref:Filamentous hemagglutinin N-terminal domain-containing protein n=1 Tax=Burkholderia sola TaxID=2843302 RepID=A0ABV2C3D3_9BURK|nr:filamentous hemagglutinin N-terminal domain-containing protein [Burkholderia sp. CpTa8-5]
MNTSKRKTLQQLAAAGAARIGARARSAASAPRFFAVEQVAGSYRWWQRATSALLALAMFIGPITVTVEQGRDAAGVLGAGNRRIDDDAWQRLLDLASLRVRFSMQLAAAAPIVDPTAPISFQPAITQSTGAGGGVPVVNITAPNAAGISLNQYQQFNIDPVGLILNNSLMSGTSLTGGNVQANPNLNGRTASVIVNQVTSTGNAYASLLNGPLEVFGAPAAVVIANPNGITTRGTGFTNTIGVTLSTGAPQFLSGVGGSATDFANAKALGYNVTGGHLQIEGNAGVNGPGAGIEGTVGTIDLIGETIGINAPLYAGTRINVIAGRQFVTPAAVDTYGTTYGTASNGSDNSAAAINAANGGANRSLAIDATAFGAMTAGQIQVVSTAAGMGVRSDAQLAANAGDLLLSANGDVSVAGSAAQQQATVHSAGNVSMTGTHIGVGGYAIDANGDVTSTGSIQSGGKLAVAAGGNVNVANAQAHGDMTVAGGTNVTLGDVQGGGALSVTARGADGTGDVNLNGTSVVTGATTVQAARDVNVNGQTNSDTLRATAQRDATVNAALQTSGALALTATQGNVVTHATVKSGGDLALTSGQDTVVASQATAQNAVSVQAGRDLSVSGSLASGTTFAADIARDASVGGSLMVGTDARVDAGRNVDTSGVVIVQRNGVLSARNDITGSGSIAFGQNGALNAAHDVALTGKLLANGLQVDAGNSANLATVQAGGAFGVTANGNAGGGDVVFNGNAAALGAADVRASRDVVVNGTLAGGAQVALAAQRNVIVGGSGTVQAVGDLAMTAASGSVASAGTLNGAGALTVQGAQDVALTGATTVTGDVTATAGRDLVIGGALAGQGVATLTAARDIVAGGTSGFAQDTTLSAGRDIGVTGAFQGRAVSMTAAGSIALNDVQANAGLRLATRTGDVSIGGNVNSLTNGTIDAARDVIVNGTLRTASSLIVGGGRNTSIGGTVQSNGDVALTNAAGSLTSTGNIQSGGNLSVNAAQSVDLGTHSTSSLGDLTVNAGRDLTMNGSVVAQGNGTLNAGGAIDGAAAVAFGLAANLGSGGDTNLTGSLRGGSVRTTAGGSATLHDVQAASTLALGAANDLSVTGAVTGGADVVLAAARDIGISGSLQSAGNTSLRATGSIGSTGAIASNGAFDAQAGSDINLGGNTTVSHDTTLAAGRDVNVSGSLAGQGQGIVNAARDIVGAGTLTFGQQATLEAGRDVAQRGLIQGQSVSVTAAGNAAVNNVESTGTIALRANGTNTATGAGDLRIDGSVAAAGAITAFAQNDVAIGGKVASGSTVGVTAQRDIAVSGAIESVGDTALAARQGSLNATGGINSGGKLAIATGLDLSLGASTSAIGDATLTAGRDATLNGTMVGQANGTVTAAHDINGGGKQAFAATANYAAQHDVALTGGMQAAAIAVTGGNNATLHDASSSTTLTLTANGNAGEGDAGITGAASAQGAANVTGARDVSIGGTLGSGDALALTAQRNVTVNGGVESNGDLKATATNGSVMLTGATTTAGAFSSLSGLDTQLGGQIAVAKSTNVQAGRDIALTGTLAGQRDGTLSAGRDINGAGSAAFAQAATLDAAHDVALTGALQAAAVNVTGGNNAGLGTVQAVNGNLDVTAKGGAGGGDVTLGGAATAFGAMQLQAARDVSVAGAINTGGTTTINAARSVALSAVNSAGDLAVTASGGNASATSLTTQGNLNVGAAQDIAVTGQSVAGGNASLNAGRDMTLAGVGAQQNGTLTAGGSVTADAIAFAHQASVTAGGNIAVTGNVATNGDLAMTAGNDLSAGSVQAGGAIGLRAQGHNGVGDVMVNGVVTSGNATTIAAARDAGIGAASSGGALNVTAGRSLGVAGAINATGDATLTATAGNLGVGGAVVSTGSLRANAGGGLALLSGGLVNGDTTLTSGGAMTLGGALFGLGAASINAGGALGGGAALTYGKDIAVNAGNSITLGAIQGAGKLTAVSGGDMSLGATTAVGDVSAKSTAGSVSFGGLLQSGGNVAVQAANNVSLAGGVGSMGTVDVNGIGGNVSVAGVSANGDATLHAGQTVALTGNSIVAGQLGVSGGNVTLSGSAVGSKNVTVSAQGTVDAGNASLVASQNLQVNGSNVTLGNATVGGALTAQASNQLTLAGGKAVNVVGNATLASQNGLYNAANVLAGSLSVSAPNLTNAAGASLASIGTTTVNASSFANAGLVNGTTTNVTVGGALTNVGGSLMAVNALNVNTGTLNNQNGIVFAGNPKAATGATGDVSLTINGGNGAFYNAGGQLLAQRDMGISAVNMAFDPSQGTISQGGNLSITAGYVNVGGTWNYGGQSVSLTGLNGIANDGTITGTSPLTLTAGGSFENHGQVTGSDVTFNGTLNNAAGAVVHADNALTLNGDTTNRGTVEAGSVLTVNGGNYDNQGATTQSKGDANFNLGGSLLNTGGSIFAGRNIGISAAQVINDQTAPQGAVTTTTQVSDPALLMSGAVGWVTAGYEKTSGHEHTVSAAYETSPATLGGLLAPTGSTTNSGLLSASNPVATSGTVTFNQYSVLTGINDHGVSQYSNYWFVGTGPEAGALKSATFTLPTVYQTATNQQAGTSGVISAGGSISLTAGTLSNKGGQIAAQGNIALNVQSLSNGAVAPTMTVNSSTYVDQAQYANFLAQLAALGTIGVQGTGNPTGAFNCDGGNYCQVGPSYLPTAFQIDKGAAAPATTGTVTFTTPTGMIAAGSNLTVGGGDLTNEGLLYAGNNVAITSGSLTNQGGNQQNYASQVGCASGVPNSACGNAGQPRGNNPTTTTFGYSQNDATIYAGHDLVIAAGQINNTYGNLLAGHDIVIGGVGTTASSTTPAQSLNNTSGNIVAGNDIKLNVSGAITNNLPPPVPVHENYGKHEQYSGCMTAGGYKESYCEGYVDQQSGSSSVISAGNNLQINAGSLTNIGSLIAAGNNATIAVAGPVVNEAQVLNAYWHSHWVQETGMFSSDKRHDIWACGTPEQCKALYGSAYTSTGGTIDPPTPVGNIAATIQAPNLSISSSGQIQNVGNVIGTYVSLTGQKLINGITTANTYTPRVNAPSQVISLSPVDLPGLNLSVPRAVGTGKLPTPVAGAASYVDASLGGSVLGSLGPQDLLNNLPSALQPSSTLFYYNPQEEDLLLQQAALKQTGKSSFVDGLTYDNEKNLSVTAQEKMYLYQNAIDYSKAHDLQLGAALTQEQINTLDKPMLWYVEQTVPDPTCHATGAASCPTIAALMPQVYLPQDTQALSAGGNISGQDVTLKFNQDGNGSILNTGSITASGTLSVDTHTLTNQANQVNVGEIWQKVDGGYLKTTGTVVQPGGFMSAANMDLNVQTLDQIGGALQKLNADGTVDQAGTQQALANLQQQLGVNFTQTSVSDHLHSDFVQEGGGLPTFAIAAIAIAASIVTAGAAAAAAGVVMTELSVGSVMIGALGGMVGSITSQAFSGNGLNFGKILQAGALGALTAGVMAGTGLANLQGLQDLGRTIGTGGAVSMGQLGQVLEKIVERGVVSAAINTAVSGGSFGSALANSMISDLGMVGAGAIGVASDNTSMLAVGSPGYVLAHAGLGCALSAAKGTGCAGGAIGGATSAVLSPLVLGAIDPAHAPLDQGQVALLAAAATFAGGGLAGLAGQNAMAGATAAHNEALNNSADHWGQNKSEAQREQDELHKQQSKEKAQLGESSIVDEGDGVSVLSPNPMAFGGAKNTPGIQFGANDNQSYHTFRHVISGGYDATAVQNAVTGNLNSIGPSLPQGLYNGTVVVNGTTFNYAAFKLPDGTINVGRITPPR